MAEETVFDEKELGEAEASDQAGEAALQTESQADMDISVNGQGEKHDFEQLTLEYAELKDQNLRLVADMENLRRRTLRDVADAKTYAVANFARDMLSVLDNLARALDAIAPDIRETDSHLNALAEGVEMTSRAMMSALERHGVQKIEAQGARFDPHFHQAMFEIPDPDKQAGTVAQVVQEGYMIAERVLRPAMVGITTGGAKEVLPEETVEN